MILNLPSLTHVLSDFFIMKIEDLSSSEALSCDVIEISYSNGFGVPQFPLDSNTFVGDTIYKNPFSLSVRVWVYEFNKNKFENQIKKANNDKGFKVFGINGVYDSLRITNYSFSESSGVQGGFFYNLDMVELQIVTAGQIAMPVPKIKNPADASPVDKGSKNPAKKEKTLLKSGVDKIGSFFK